MSSSANRQEDNLIREPLGCRYDLRSVLGEELFNTIRDGMDPIVVQELDRTGIERSVWRFYRYIRKQFFPAIPFRNHDYKWPLLYLVISQPRMTPYSLDSFDQDCVLACDAFSSQPLRAILHLRIV